VVDDSAFFTDGGPFRRRNEDFALANQDQGLYIVADGLGGAAAGDRASRVATESVSDFLQTDEPPLAALDAQVSDRLTRSALRAMASRDYERGKTDERLRMAFLVAHCKVLEEGRNTGCLGMATAMVAAWQENGDLWICHVGDCRAYSLLAGELDLHTKDHSLSVALADRDSLPLEIRDSPFLRSRLTQVVGGETVPNPDVEMLQPASGTRLLFCTDGVWGSLSEEAIANALGADATAEEICKTLVEQAIEEGSRDNATALVVMI
jgi:protein phosphatase